MKTFFRNILIFGLFAALGYFILVGVGGLAFPKNYKYLANISYRPGPSSNGHLKTRLEEISHVRDVDILIIGSSHAYRGFDPRIFKPYGYSLFNLGSSAQTPEQGYFLLNEYLDKINPKKVIFEVYPETFAADGIESATDVISNHPLSLRLVAHSFSYSNIRVFNTLLFRLFDEMVLQNEWIESEVRGSDTYIKGGFVASTEEFYKPKEMPFEGKFEFNEKQFKYFEKSVTLLKDRGIPYIFIQAPVTQLLDRSRPTPVEFGERLRKLGSYHNYQGELNINDSLDFMDNDHLSQSGVEKFDVAVIENDLNDK